MTFWDRVAPLYDRLERTNAAVVDEMISAVAALVPQGASVLECAAGTGAISMAASPRAGRVLCTDLSLPMLDAARKKAANLPNVAFAQRDLYHLSDPDESCDVVVAAIVLHLLPDPENAVRELWRVTKHGGLVVLPTFLQGEASPGYRVVLLLYTLVGFRPRYRFTLDSYRVLLDGCGLGDWSCSRIPGRLPLGLAVLRK